MCNDNLSVYYINAPFDPRKYIQAIHDAENEGYDVLIIDSLSHCWISEGGLLDMKEQLATSGKYNSFSAWSKVTPLQNKLIEAMLTSNAILAVTQGRGSKEWTLDDINALQSELDARKTPEELPQAV